jgi:hypothetical protein
MIIGITIKVISTNIYITLSRWTLQHKYTYETYYYKTSFPTVLAYVIIGHKAQGATITSKLFVHVKKSFILGFTYVMLSKVTNRANLMIRGNLKSSEFICFDQC